MSKVRLTAISDENVEGGREGRSPSCLHEGGGGESPDIALQVPHVSAHTGRASEQLGRRDTKQGCFSQDRNSERLPARRGRRPKRSAEAGDVPARHVSSPSGARSPSLPPVPDGQLPEELTAASKRSGVAVWMVSHHNGHPPDSYPARRILVSHHHQPLRCNFKKPVRTWYTNSSTVLLTTESHSLPLMDVQLQGRRMT